MSMGYYRLGTNENILNKSDFMSPTQRREEYRKRLQKSLGFAGPLPSDAPLFEITPRESRPEPIIAYHEPPRVADTLLTTTALQSPAFSGNVCTNCGAAAMVRTGHCETCQACGETSGCS